MSRVLHICSGNLYGGVETIQVNLARYREETPEIDIHFTVCFDGRLNQELKAAGVPVHHLGVVRVRNPFSIWKARAALRKLLSHVQYDAAICHSSWTQAIFGPVVRAARVPLLVWLHGEPSGRHWLQRWASRTRPEKVICCSEFTRHLLGKLDPSLSSEVFYPAVPRTMGHIQDSRQRLATRLAIRKELETPPDAIVIVQVSRMESWKGHKLHLIALAKMRDVSKWTCWIVGGAQRPSEEVHFAELKQMVQQYGIADRIRFLGQRSDVHELLASADIFCQPNTGPEPFGVVFVEALSSGLPVITTAMGGGLEIVDSTCGILSQPNDAEGLETALRRMVTDSELRLRLSLGGPARARELCDPSLRMRRLADIIGNTFVQKGAA